MQDLAFDLWNHQDVEEHAAEILGRLRSGSMRCDGAWSPERIDVFARWLEQARPSSQVLATIKEKRESPKARCS